MEDREQRAARQRISAILTMEAMVEQGAQFRPMIEVIGPDGEAAALIGWPGRGEDPNARAFALGIALSVAALYAPSAFCVVADARVRSLASVGELPANYTTEWLRDDPEARECVLLIRSEPERSTMEVLIYGRDDQGRLVWEEAPEALREAPLTGSDPISRIVRQFWSKEGIGRLFVTDPTDEERQVRITTARMVLPGLQVYPLEDLGENP